VLPEHEPASGRLRAASRRPALGAPHGRADARLGLLWVYKLGLSTLKTDLSTCLLEFSKHLDPQAVLDVQYSPADRTVRIDFANGVRRTLPWSALQLPPLRPALLPETIRVGEDPELIEILDGAGEVYDIATARLRAFAGPARGPYPVNNL
jgi:hypothetical protein